MFFSAPLHQPAVDKQAVDCLSLLLLQHIGLFGMQFLKSGYAFPFVVGLGAGGIGSLVGLGGSFIALPFLTGPMGLPQGIASGTAMASVLATSVGGSAAFSTRNMLKYNEAEQKNVFDSLNVSEKIGDVHISTALLIAVTSTFAVVTGAKFSKKVDPNKLKLAQGLLQIVVAPSPIISKYLQRREAKGAGEKDTVAKHGQSFFQSLYSWQAAETASLGVAAGFLGGLFGVGGGAIVVPALCVFTDLDYQTSLGTSLAAMMPMAINGCFTHFGQGTMNTRIALPLGAGALVASYCGGRYGTKVGDDNLMYLFASLMTVVGGNTIRIALKSLR
jgi:uncharacterized membrane protein YfcA